jgi:ABC-2 type transport system ATP-binding protein
MTAMKNETRGSHMVIARMADIVKRYGTHLVLDNVSIEMGKGEIVGLLGPNGAGKTTLLFALTGLIEVDSGEIELFGRPLGDNTLETKRRIGFVTQEVSVFQDLTARENLEFFGGIYGLRGPGLKQRVQHALEIVGLAEYANRLPAKFSGGMSRRLNIACALVHAPEFLIMDEPTVGVDPQSRRHILETVRELNRQGTTVLYTTHYMEEVQAIASRVIILDQGHVIAEGTISDLVEQIRHEERIRLEVVDVTEPLLQNLRKLEGVKGVVVEDRIVRITTQVGFGNLDRVLAAASEAGGVLSINAERPTLEDVFLTLTGKQLRDGGEE